MRLRAVVDTELEIEEWQLARLNTGNIIRPWQQSRVFKNVPAGGGYIFYAKATTGEIFTYEIPYEEPIKVIAYGGYIASATIWVTGATNILSQMRTEWGIDRENMRENDLGWSSNFDFGHIRSLPTYFIDAEHHYYLTFRSYFNQRTTVNGRYVLTPSDLDPIDIRIFTKIGLETFDFKELNVLINDPFNAEIVVSSPNVKEENLTQPIIAQETFDFKEIEHTYSLEPSFTHQIN